MDNKRQLDELFKQQQQRYERPLSDDLWMRLEHRLDQQKPRRRLLSAWSQVLTVAAVLLLIMLPVAYYMTILNPKQTKQEIAQTQTNNTATDIENTNPYPAVTNDNNSQNPTQHTTEQTLPQNAAASEQKARGSNIQNNPENTIISHPTTKASELHKEYTSPVSPSKPSIAQSQSKQEAKDIAENASNADITPAETSTKTTTTATMPATQTIDMMKSRGSNNRAKPQTPQARSIITLALAPNEAIAYINTLQQMLNNSPVQVNTTKNTLTSTDIANLMPLLDSTAPAAAVSQQGQTSPNTIPTSTVGNEAYWLIKSYKDKSNYPPKLSVKINNSGQITTYNTSKEIKMLRDWWAKQ